MITVSIPRHSFQISPSLSPSFSQSLGDDR